jgi:pilus assembly protein Flp/PilA
MRTFLKNFANDEQGVTAIEYSMIAALVAVAIVGVLGSVGGDLKNTFTAVDNALQNANAP